MQIQNHNFAVSLFSNHTTKSSQSTITKLVNNFVKSDSIDISENVNINTQVSSLTDSQKSEEVSKVVNSLSVSLDDVTGIVNTMKAEAQELTKDGLSDDEKQKHVDGINKLMRLLNGFDGAIGKFIEYSPVKNEMIRLKANTTSDNADLKGLQDMTSDPNQIITFSSSALGLDGLDLNSKKGIEDALDKFDKAITAVAGEKKFVAAMVDEQKKMFSQSSLTPQTIKNVLNDFKNKTLNNSVDMIKVQANLHNKAVLQLLS